ncbi:phosphonate ABC transporter, permease protein PhnE [Thalassospiraceae bacterium LMO-JJ14]|nr:phosphonate ABC transporter, permease protein PhnE [Thalassospiraceae bacterium LMO-JJ14]
MASAPLKPNLKGSLAAVADGVVEKRRRSRMFSAGATVVLLALVAWSIDVTVIQDTDWERIGSVEKVWEATSRFIGIDFELFGTLMVPALETLLIACLGTFFGLILCVPAAWFGAMNITPYKPVTYPLARLMMTLSRSIHEIVWALFFVAVVGLGAMAGVMAIAVRSVGFIAKMSAEAIEDIDHGPVEAIRAVGGSPLQIIIYAILPQVLPQIVSVVIFEWEINIRRSAILGLVGAGGLGLVFFRQMNTFNYHGVTTVILAILIIILLGEAVSYFIRRRLI